MAAESLRAASHTPTDGARRILPTCMKSTGQAGEGVTRDTGREREEKERERERER